MFCICLPTRQGEDPDFAHKCQPRGSMICSLCPVSTRYLSLWKFSCLHIERYRLSGWVTSLRCIFTRATCSFCLVFHLRIAKAFYIVWESKVPAKTCCIGPMVFDLDMCPVAWFYARATNLKVFLCVCVCICSIYRKYICKSPPKGPPFLKREWLEELNKKDGNVKANNSCE